MNIPKLVASNVMRRPGRLLFTLLGIAVGIAALVTLLALSGSLRHEVDRKAAGLGASLVVTPKGWCSYEQISVLTGEQLPEALPMQTVERIAALPGIRAVSYLTERTAIDNQPVPVVGVQPEPMRAFKSWKMAKGAYLSDASTGTVVIGTGVAKQFKIGVGAPLTIKGQQFRVAGVLEETGGQDDVSMFMPLAEAQRAYETKDMVSFMAVKVDDLSKVDEYAAKIQDVANVSVVSDKQMLSSILALVSTVSITLQLIAAIAVLAAAFGIINTMMTAVYERRREIGILQAMGATRAFIFRAFLLESLVYGLLGGLLGIVLGLVFALTAAPSVAAGALQTVLGGSAASISVEPSTLGLCLLFSVVVALVAGVYPAWRASSLMPVEAISYE